MINEFLFRLVNDATVSFGLIPRPGAEVTPYVGGRRAVQDALLAGGNAKDRFKAAVALTLLLRSSSIAALETRNDPRLAYTAADLSDELIGGVDTLERPAGITVAYTFSKESPAEEVWTATVFAGNKLSVVSSLGTEVVDVVFAAATSVEIPLRNGAITLHVVGIPAVGDRIVIKRKATYRYDLVAATRRLDLAGEAALFETTPVGLHALLRNTFVMKTTTRLVVAAAGVAYGR